MHTQKHFEDKVCAQIAEPITIMLYITQKHRVQTNLLGTWITFEGNLARIRMKRKETYTLLTFLSTIQ
jgi:hypothetical protein